MDVVIIGFDLETVHHHFDGMRLIAIQLHARHYLPYLSIHTDMHESLLANGLEQLFVMSFSARNERCQQKDLLTGIVTDDEVDDLLVGELDHRFAGQIGIGDAGTGKEKTQEIIHFGDRADRRTRVLGGGLLVDGDNRAQAGNLIHVGTLHLADEPAGIGGERLHITALALGKDGVEGQRRLTRSAQTGDDR